MRDGSRRDIESGSDSPGSGNHRDYRAVSEFTGVAILVAITVLVTASVGLSVFVVDSTASDGVDANFTFQYISQSSTLVITFDRGGPIAAGNMTVRGQGSEATWAELAGSNESVMVAPGSAESTVQLGSSNAFDANVNARGGIRVVYTGGANETVVDDWDGN